MPGEKSFDEKYEKEKAKTEKAEQQKTMADEKAKRPSIFERFNVLRKIRDTFLKGVDTVKTALEGMSIRLLGGREGYNRWIEARNTMVDENELKNAKNPFEVGNKVVCPKGDIYMEGKIIENVKSEKGEYYKVEFVDGTFQSYPADKMMTFDDFLYRNRSLPDKYKMPFMDEAMYKEAQKKKEPETREMGKEADKAYAERAPIPKGASIAEHIETAKEGDYLVFVSGNKALDAKLIKAGENYSTIEVAGRQGRVSNDLLYGRQDLTNAKDIDLSKLSDILKPRPQQERNEPNKETRDHKQKTNPKEKTQKAGTREDQNTKKNEEQKDTEKDAQAKTTPEKTQKEASEPTQKTPEVENIPLPDDKFAPPEQDEVVDFTTVLDENESEPVVEQTQEKKPVRVSSSRDDMVPGDHVLYSYKGKNQEAEVTAINKKTVELHTNDGRKAIIQKPNVENSIFGYNEIKDNKVMRQCVEDPNNTKFSEAFREAYHDWEFSDKLFNEQPELDDLDIENEPEPLKGLDEQMAEAAQEVEANAFSSRSNSRNDFEAIEM